jgi:hypothetical protein
VTVSLLKSSKTPEALASAPVYRKPRADLYTVLLVIALLALLVGILFLYAENSFYEWKTKGAPAAAMLQDQTPAGRNQGMVAGTQPSAFGGQFADVG